MIINFNKYRPPPTYHIYPPYHNGPYLEDYFYNYFTSKNIKVNRILIPVSWTTCYIEKLTDGLQEALNGLNPNLSYFTVSQHDDAIKEKLPPDTISFCAGGNKGGIPIPLVCNKIPMEDIKRNSSNVRDLLCSFYGSNTHFLRQQLIKEFNNKPDTHVFIHNWSSRVTQDDYDKYLFYSLRSRFLLCPRGYGLNSFRLYESFQLGCVPVVISDKDFLPWKSHIDWDSFAVVASSTKNLYEILVNISDSDYVNMLKKGQIVYNKYFSLNGICEQIIEFLIRDNHEK